MAYGPRGAAGRHERASVGTPVFGAGPREVFFLADDMMTTHFRMSRHGRGIRGPPGIGRTLSDLRIDVEGETMRKSLIGVIALFAGAILAASAQEIPPGRDTGKQDDQKTLQTSQGEVRVYLLDREKKPVDLKDITASLMLEDKTGVKKTVPMQLVTPKADEKTTVGYEGQLREVEGGQHWAEMVVVKGDLKPGFKEKEEPGRRNGTPEDKKLEEKPPGGDKSGLDERPFQFGEKKPGEPQDRPLKGQEKRHTYTGSYFKADLGKEDWPAEFSASVVFRIKGETKTARGFKFPFLAMGNGDGASAHAQNDLQALEGQIRAGDWEKAHATVDHLLECVKACKPATGDAGEFDTKYRDFESACKDLKAAITARDEEQATLHLNKCKAACEGLKGPAEKYEKKGNGLEPKPEDEKKGND